MGESKSEQIDRLLREGLDHYGMDEVATAILTWEQILAIDPTHVEARDYIQTADRRSKPRSPRTAAEAAGSEAAVLEESRAMLRQGQTAEAFELLAASATAGSPALDFEAGYELARSRLYREIRGRIGGLNGIPRVVASDEQLRGYNLPPDAGFLLSMVDGMTPISDLISVSGMDAFGALRTLEGLVEANLVELRE